MAKKLNKWQNEILKLENQANKQLENDLKETYEEILKDVRREIRAYGDEFEDLPYYKQVRAGNLRQLQNEVVEMLNSAEPEVNRRIVGFKESEVVEGYFQSMYQVEMESMQPIDFIGLNRDFVRTAVEKPVSGQRLSSRLYKYRNRLAKKAQSAITVGISQGMAYEKIADRIRNETESNYKQALRIARTEGGRLRSEAKDIAYQEAADKGVKFQEMWVSALDSKTRSTHRAMDGQTVEVGEDFKSPSGASGPGPKLLGSASEDINCRCTKIATFEGQPPLSRRDGEGNVVEYQDYNEWAGIRISDSASPESLVTSASKPFDLLAIDSQNTDEIITEAIKRTKTFVNDYKETSGVDVIELWKKKKFVDKENPYSDEKAKFMEHLLQQTGYDSTPQNLNDTTNLQKIYRGVVDYEDGSVTASDLVERFVSGKYDGSGATSSVHGRGIYFSPTDDVAKEYGDQIIEAYITKEAKLADDAALQNIKNHFKRNKEIYGDDAEIYEFMTKMNNFTDKQDDVLAILHGYDGINSGRVINIFNRGILGVE